MFWRKLMSEPKLPNLYDFTNNPKVGETFTLEETNSEGETNESEIICISDGQSQITDIPDELKFFLMMLHSTL
jgi:hypothetical protein